MNDQAKADSDAKLEAFTKDVARALNKHGLDGAIGTPDFILAEYMVGCLLGYGMTIEKLGKHLAAKAVVGQGNVKP